jgi:hypothetical protein
MSGLEMGWELRKEYIMTAREIRALNAVQIRHGKAQSKTKPDVHDHREGEFD